MWNVDAIVALTEKFNSFEVYVATPYECNCLIEILRCIGASCGEDLRADEYVPFPYFHIHKGMWVGGNSRRARESRPLFTYDEFIGTFFLQDCPDDDINMDSVL